MSENDQNTASARSDELERLAKCSCEGTLLDKDRQQLEELLVAREEFRSQYLDYVQVHAELRWRFRQEISKPNFRHSSETKIEPARRSKSWLDRASRHPLVPSFGITVAIFVAVLVGMAVIPVAQRIAGGGKDDDAERRQPEGPTSSEYVAILNGRKDVKWLEGTRPSLGDPRLKVGRKLVLASGVIEVKYYTGARVVIEGPAEFYVGMKDEGGRLKDEEGKSDIHPSSFILQPSNAGFLQRGSLVARVEGKKADGFTIDTPSARVEDFGTEFGVEVNGSGAAEVVVLTGEVDVIREDGDGSPQRVRLVKDQGAFVAKRGGPISRRSKVAPAWVTAMRTRLQWIDSAPADTVAQTPAHAVPMTTPRDGYTGSYRIAFVTTGKTTPVSDDIGTYNTFVTDAAAAVTELNALGATWKVIGSTVAVSAKVNTGTLLSGDPGYSSASDVPIYTTSGLRIANNNADLWDGNIINPIYFDVGTVAGVEGGVQEEAWTGTSTDGTSDGNGNGLPQDQNALGTGPQVGENPNYMTMVRGGYTDGNWITGPSAHEGISLHLMALSAPITPAVPEPGSAESSKEGQER